MEEDADDLDNLFDEYDSNDPQPGENATNENAENDSAVPEKVPAPKRVVKHPRLKFNPERLCGKRGIPILVDHFKDVKFKGKGHEKEDLKKLLTTLELWTHRLFPSMKFEDCLRQVEHLGKKRPVKTCVQKIRLDFPILDKDFVRNEDEDEEQEQPDELEPEPPAQDAFDRLFDDYRERAEPVLTSTPSSSQTEGNVLGTSFGASISEEQKKRMEYNKMLAIERRKARLSNMQTNSFNTESSTNEETAFNSPATGRIDTNDPNFLFHYLQKQFTNTGNSKDNETNKRCSQPLQSKNGQVLERDKMVESVDENDRNKTDYDVLSNVTNNACTKDNGKEELEMDELMDLVDEDNETHDSPSSKDKDEIDPAASNKCSDDNAKEELELDELMDLVDEDNKEETDLDALSNNCHGDNGKEDLALNESMDLVNEDNLEDTDHDSPSAKDKDEIDPVALPNNPNDNDKEELGLNELVDLVDEGDRNETDHDTLSCSKSTDETLHIVVPSVRTTDCPRRNCKEELELDELMDLVKDHQDKTDDVVLPCKNISDSDNYEQLSSKEPEISAGDCIKKIKETDTELQDNHADNIL